MANEAISEMTAEDAALLDLGVALGQNHAFALVAGRCSAAQAQGLKRLRDEKLYKRCEERWLDFCPKYLKISRVEADRIIHLWEEIELCEWQTRLRSYRQLSSRLRCYQTAPIRHKEKFTNQPRSRCSASCDHIKTPRFFPSR